nr:hypothetical protein [Candidatus Sigynarchaeota archaeon]
LLSFLAAIGGQVKDVHFKGCGIHPETGKLDLEPLLREVREWLEKSSREINEDEALVNFLGERTPVKQWLVSSLEKTIRAQTIV